jgi:hypothetical protein
MLAADAARFNRRADIVTLSTVLMGPSHGRVVHADSDVTPGAPVRARA